MPWRARFASLAHPKMLLLMIWPIAIALALWTMLAVIFGAQTVAWLQGYLTTSAVGVWASAWFPFNVIAAVLSWVALLVLFFPLVLVTATLLISVFSMPAMVTHVAAADYPTLERRRGGTFGGSICNAGVALAVFLVLSLLSLPLWFVPLFWPVLPVLLFAYLNQRVFRYDAFAEHGSVEELREIFRRYGKPLYGLGIVVLADRSHSGGGVLHPGDRGARLHPLLPGAARRVAPLRHRSLAR